MAQLIGESIEVEASEHVVDRLSTRLTDELLGIGVFELGITWIFLIEVIKVVEVLLFGEDGIGILIERLSGGLLRQVIIDARLEHTTLDEDVALVVDDRLELLGRETKEVAHLVGE